MAKKDEGKRFEQDIKASFPPDFFTERYKDDTAGFYGVSNPADYRLYKYPYTILLELKSHKGKSIPFSVIRENQIKGMLKAIKYKGVYGGFILNFRDVEETYFIRVWDMWVFMENTDRKSVPLEWCRENGVRIEQKKKISRYSYDLESWLGGYYAKSNSM